MGGVGSAIQSFAGSAFGIGRSGNVSGQGHLDDLNALAQQNAQQQIKNQTDLQPQQTAFGQQLADRAMGKAPSIAEAQMRATQDRNLSQQMAAAKANRQVNPALAQRQVQRLAADGNQQVVQASGIAKLQEDAQNQQAFGNYLNQQQQNTNNALGRGQSSAESLFGAQMGKRASDINQTGNMINMGAGLLGMGGMSDRNQKTEITDASSTPGHKKPKTHYSDGGMMDMAIKLAPLAMMAFSDKNSKTDVHSAASQPGNQPQQNNYAEGGLIPSMKAGDGKDFYIPQAGNLFAQYLSGLEKNVNAEKKGGGGSMPSMPGGDAQGTMMAGGPMDNMGAAEGGGLLDMAGSGATMMASNGGKVPGTPVVKGDSPKNDIVNAKLSPGEVVVPRTVVNKGPEAAAKFVDQVEEENFNPKSFLDALQPYAYKYKNPNLPGAGEGRHMSVMAQDLEKAGPVGASMVKETPNGKMVDYGRGFGAILAAQADLNQRLADIETRYGKKK